jgi:hypothetical protein
MEGDEANQLRFLCEGYKMSILLNCDLLRAVSLAASNEESRHYLRGVFVELREESAITVATNGHALLAAHHKIKNVEKMRADIIIPIDVIKLFKPVRGQTTVELANLDGTRWMLNNIVFTPIDGTFPTWRLVLPKSVGEIGVENVWFSTEYQTIMTKASKLCGSDGIFTIHPCGLVPALVMFQKRDIFGVIMPIKQNRDAGASIPDWVEKI